MIFDSHAHYDDEKFEIDREALLASLRENNVYKLVDVSATMDSIPKILELTKKYDFIYGSVGIHPDEVADLNDEKMLYLEDCARDDKIVAIGEIGLDYYWDEAPRDVQKKWFQAQIDLAKKLNKPIIIHSRDACNDTMEILRKPENTDIKAVMHCYSYSKETALELIDMNFMFGIGGVVTFKNSKKLKEAVEVIPMERILLETDCPYLAPEPYRGKRNDSSLIKYVIEEIARIKGLAPNEVEEIAWNNTLHFYNI